MCFCFKVFCLKSKQILVNTSSVTKPNNYDIDSTGLSFMHEILLSRSSGRFSDDSLKLTVSVFCMSFLHILDWILTSQGWQGIVKSISSISYIWTKLYKKHHISSHLGWEGGQRKYYLEVVLFNSMESRAVTWHCCREYAAGCFLKNKLISWSFGLNFSSIFSLLQQFSN